ncbi:MAG: CoA transferase [Pseudomonadota bacterium]
MKTILKGLRVAEVSAYVAAPLCGLTLVQMGAEVIQISPIGGRMDSDRWPHSPVGKSLYWAALNRGKRSIRIDLKQPVGRELAARIMAGAPGDGGGIVLNNLPLKGPMAEEALRERRPDLILITLIGNPDGSPAIDYTVNSASGLPYLTGEGDPPVNHAVPVWDLVAGLYLATGLLAADRHRQHNGKGQTVTLSLFDAMLASIGNLGFLSEAQLCETPRPAAGNQVYGAFGRDFELADGRRIMVAAISDKQWEALLEATGLSAAMQRLRDEEGLDVDDEIGRYHARDQISAVLAPWFAAQSLAQVTQAFAGKGILWGPFRTLRQLLEEDPRCSLENPVLGPAQQAGIGRHLVPHLPLTFEGAIRGDVPSAPDLGEHSEAVLADVLGLPSGEIGRLFDSGIVGGVEAG